ncbi:MAG: HAD family hydrolase [Candidatus Micrarchaeaceae archaeon]
MPIKALVIDLDGTLYEGSELAEISTANMKRVHAFLKRRGILELVPKALLKRLDNRMKEGEISGSVIYLSRRYHIDEKKFSDYVNNIHPRSFRIRKDKRLISLLSNLSKRYKIFLFTNAPSIWARRALKILGLNGLIKWKNVMHQESLNDHMKPDPEAYRIVLRKFRLNEREVIFMDDIDKNVAAARKMGIKSFHILNKRGSRRTIYLILEKIKSNIY